MAPLPWREAWHDALYADGSGFYVTGDGPAAHFATATHAPTGRVLAEALLALWSEQHGGPPSVVVDVGAGRGELASELADALALGAASRTGGSRPATRVVAVDVVQRPGRLDGGVHWLRSPGGAALPDELHGLREALVVAHEWLDVVPCAVAQVDGDGRPRELLVDPVTGAESLGSALGEADRRWAQEHWPTTTPGDRIEVGLSRDAAWADLVSRVDSGTLVAVDYGHTRTARPSQGTLTAYVGGRQTHPVPDGSCDITAHVAMDTLDADGPVRQRDLLRDLGLTGATPPIGLASSDPLRYVRALERAGAEARLIDPAGFGGFWWAVKRVEAADVP